MTWKIETRPNWYCIYDEMGWYVAGCQSEQQAQLIANAPVMLEALETIVGLGNWMEEKEVVCNRMEEIARAAIAAAIAAMKGEDSEKA